MRNDASLVFSRNQRLDSHRISQGITITITTGRRVGIRTRLHVTLRRSRPMGNRRRKRNKHR